jgi:glycogen operon protein
MIVAGDEMGRTQGGNNNAYCQDNEISWVDWNLDARRKALLEFTSRLIQFRHHQPVLQRRRFFQGDHIWDSHFKDLAWYRPDGTEMTAADWEKPFVRSLAFLLGGDAIPTPDERGQRIFGAGLLVMLNAHHEPVKFTVPPAPAEHQWVLEFYTADDSRGPEPLQSNSFELTGRSLAVLREVPRGEEA